MPVYKITFARSARKELQAFPANVAERILEKIEYLAEYARPAGCKKLSGVMGLWRLRVGQYRVIYKIDDDNRTIDVVIIRHRRDVYR
jgi:mRNA interferase RelE/StbE